MNCRHCGSILRLPFLDLGSAPPSNAYLSPESANGPELWYPLRLLVCETCWLVQTEDFAGRESFFNDDYAYFSSFSISWLAHAKSFVDETLARFSLNNSSLVVEVAANDGYLLQYVQQAGIPCLGIEPTAGTAAAARSRGIDVIEDFFGQNLAENLAKRGHSADLIVANNVLAHVPDINDFVAGFAALLKPEGVATFEFPHLLNMVEQCQFDTAYHEHYSYLSLSSVERIFAKNGLQVFDVQTLGTHGGSLRVYAQLKDRGLYRVTDSVVNLLALEEKVGVKTPAFYIGFQEQAIRIAHDLLMFMLEKRRLGQTVAAYGAAAKGNTLLNFSGVRPHLLPFVVDKNPAKQGKLLPGSRVPVYEEAQIREMRPNYILILPWNLKLEVMEQLAYVRDWGGQFVTAVPYLELL